MICTNCGGPISASEALAVCEYCGTHAETPHHAQAGGAVADGSLEDDLQHVERWWQEKSRPFVKIDRQGNRHPPAERNIIYVVLMALGGVLGLGSAMAGHELDSTLLGFGGFFLFPLVISLPAALLHQRAERRCQAYQALESEYQGRRQTIIERHARGIRA